MPNAQCDVCKQWLNTICHDEATRDRLRVLINERSKKRFGIIYDVTPGVKHNEVDPSNTAGEQGACCRGTLWYKPFSRTPPGIQWGGESKSKAGGGGTDK